MAIEHLAVFMAIATGLTSSGIVGSVWALATGEPPRLQDILDPNPSFLTPFRVMAAVFSAPTAVIVDGFWWLIAQPLFGVPLIVAGLLWSFLQGVFILTQVFGFT